MIKRSEIQDLVSNYDCDKVKIGIFGSQSALEQGLAAKYAGFETVVVVEKGRDATYIVHNRHLFDEVVSVDNFKDALEERIQKKLRENTIMLPNRSMVAYWGIEEIENNFFVPLYGNRYLLRAEDRNSPAPRNQYYLLEKAGIRMPRLFHSPDEIDRLVVVKVQQKDNTRERAYFYPSSPEEYYRMREEGINKGLISEEGAEKASIEEYIVGPYVNANFHVFALKDIFQNNFELIGFSDREQTNEGGFRNLPASLQLKLEESFQRTNEEICHRGKTIRESKLEEVYSVAERFFKTLEKEVPPGIIGMVGLQGAFPIDERRRPRFVVFDVSFRIPGDPIMGPTSPFLHSVGAFTIKHRRILQKLRKPYGERKINFPLDLTMMEIEVAANMRRLEEIVT